MESKLKRNVLSSSGRTELFINPKQQSLHEARRADRVRQSINQSSDGPVKNE
jgi:hypothetical protein